MLDYKIIQDADTTISVMQNAGMWLEESGKNPSKWWKPNNMNREFLFQHAEPDEFYTLFINGEPAAGMVLQNTDRSESWKNIDHGNNKNALYVHWICVHRKYAGIGLPRIMVDFAETYAKSKDIHTLRVDTNAEVFKLCKIYEDLGFTLVAVEQEDYRQTAFYQKELN